MGSTTVTLEQLYSEIPAAELNAALFSLVLSCLFIAFLSFRFLKIEIVISAAISGYSLGVQVSSAALADRISGFNFPVVVGLACAVIFALLSVAVYRLCIRLIGGIFGAAIGFALPFALLSSLLPDVLAVGIIVGAVVGIVLFVVFAKLFYRVFKPVYIVLSSFSGSVLAMAYLSLLLFGINEGLFALFAILGLPLGVLASIVQFKINKDRPTF